MRPLCDVNNCTDIHTQLSIGTNFTLKCDSCCVVDSDHEHLVYDFAEPDMQMTAKSIFCKLHVSVFLCESCHLIDAIMVLVVYDFTYSS